MSELISRDAVVEALLAHTPKGLIRKMLTEGYCGYCGFNALSGPDLAAAAEQLLPDLQKYLLSDELDILQNSADNHKAPAGSGFYRVLVTRDAGTESAEVYINAKSAKEAELEALSLVNANKVTMRLDDNDQTDAYICDSDCVELLSEI